MTITTALIGIIVALIGGGAVSYYLAKPRKESINIASSERALKVVSMAIERLEKELHDALSRIEVLESELEASRGLIKTISEATIETTKATSLAATEALRIAMEARSILEDKISMLTKEVSDLQKRLDNNA